MKPDQGKVHGVEFKIAGGMKSALNFEQNYIRLKIYHDNNPAYVSYFDQSESRALEVVVKRLVFYAQDLGSNQDEEGMNFRTFRRWKVSWLVGHHRDGSPSTGF